MRRTVPHLRTTFLTYRSFSVLSPRRTSWSPSPAPPRLPKEDQEIFEELQRRSTGAFSTPQAADPEAESQPQDEQQQSQTSSDASSTTTEQQLLRQKLQQRLQQMNQFNQAASQADQSSQSPGEQPRVRTGDGEELHPNYRRGAPPEFEGDVNPKTGETGGPKNEPLRWGNAGDWSYNGRVTDF